MRPSYDAEHPHSTTPIYDELYSEYRRLFRALPGDRSGEEDLKFTGFAIREGYPLPVDPRSYPQQQAFQTYGGQAAGLPQFMPAQQANPHPANPTSDGYGQATQHATGHHPTGHHTTGHHPTGHHTTGHHTTGNHTTGNHPAGPHATGHHATGPHTPGAHATGHHHITNHHPGGHHQPNGHQVQPTPQFTNGQGWVAAGFLGSPGQVPHPMPAPPPVPSPMMGTAPSAAAGGRHRQMLSLPPGRMGDHH